MNITQLRWAALTVAILVAGSGPAWSQRRAISIRDVSGEIGAGFDGSWIDFPAIEGARRLTFREWVTLRASGDIIDPRLFAFDVMIRPTRLQLDWSGPVTLRNGDGDRFDLNAGITLFRTRPVSLSGGVFRNSGTTPSPFGVESDVETTEWRADLDFTNRYLPARLSFRDRSLDEIVRSPVQARSVRQDADIQTATLLAQNSKIRLFGERRDYDDHANHQDFITNTASVDHRFRWGKGSRLTSAFDYLDRTGAGAYERIAWDEAVHLQHTWSVETDYRFGLQRVETLGNTVRTKFGEVRATVRPLPALTVGAEFRGQSNRFAAGKQTYYRWGPRASYRTSLPHRGHLSVGGSLGFERVDQEVGAGGRIPVVNERHPVDPSGRFTLDNAEVDAATVILTDLTETVVYQDGFDYQLLPSGPLLEVLTLPGGRIAVGDTVLVDYTFLIVSAGRVDALLGTYNGELSLAGVTLYHRRTIRNEDNGLGTAGLGGAQNGAGSILSIADRDDMTTGIRAQHGISKATVMLSAERRRLESNEAEFRTTSVRGTLMFTLRENLRGTIGGNWSSTESADLTRDVWTANSGLEWMVAPPLTVRSSLTTWRWTETGGTRQNFIGGTLEVDLRVRLLTLQIRYDHHVWKDLFENTENRMFARVVRSF